MANPGTYAPGRRDACQDLVLEARPDDPEFREGINVWLMDNDGRFVLPRFGIEAIGRSWDLRATQVNVGFPDGRVLIASSTETAHSPFDAAGRPAVFGAGPMVFHCVVPFERWQLNFEGTAVDTTVEAQLAGNIDYDRLVDLSIAVDMTMVVPPWIRGEGTKAARDRLAGTAEERFIGGLGGFNGKQLFTASGVFRVADEAMSFNATGLRVHRRGVRTTGGFRGHCWQSAVFPDGTAFEALAFPDQADGTPTYNEGFVYDGRSVYPATVVDAPWMRSFVPHGGDVSLVLDSELGRSEIHGVTRASTVMPDASATSKVAVMGRGPSNDLFFHQGSAEYTWGGQTALGMVERSLPTAQVERPTSDNSQGVRT